MQNVTRDSQSLKIEDLSVSARLEESIESHNMTIDSGKVIVNKSDAQFDFRKKLAILRQHLEEKNNSSDKASAVISADRIEVPQPESLPLIISLTSNKHEHDQEPLKL